MKETSQQIADRWVEEAAQPYRRWLAAEKAKDALGPQDPYQPAYDSWNHDPGFGKDAFWDYSKVGHWYHSTGTPDRGYSTHTPGWHPIGGRPISLDKVRKQEREKPFIWASTAIIAIIILISNAT
jgi:hypothetical protein